ncbi:hypothetical protein KY290_005454 [Solanum tuberosum]|uniref:Endonuclease/exonuclease/phosphatase domain-containing protein n=1 Tax=Solanum tuberosum TaxID=4113 RepID=A0ABQ7WGN3_SOLTU|nr:hypothetical protein KY289_005846 [Solanum tuberosum]KAH0779027.1 hypothetical protein KY290_005454 [Solanum tuberosum]
MPFNEGLSEIKILASQFLETLSHWESSSKLPQVENSTEKGLTPMEIQGEKSDIHQETASQNMIGKSGVMQLQEKGDCSRETDVGCEEQNMQIQQIHDVEPVASNTPRKTNGEVEIQQIHDAEPLSIQSPGVQTDAEVEASNWISSHILELSRSYGVAFEGFRGETNALLMKHDERKRGMEKKGEKSEATTSRQRRISKNELKKLQSDLNQEVEGETKISKDVNRIAKQLWASRWMRYGYIEADGSIGGVLIMWDSRIWVGSSVEEGKFSITYKFEVVQDGFCWFLTVRELCGGPWVTCGDFNTIRAMAEMRGCMRITNVMTEFSRWIEDMELHDPCLRGGNFTWFRGPNQHSSARLDRFLYSTEWDEQFRNIRQQIMPRVISDFSPIMLQCGDWEQRKPYFKFENWWTNVEGFKDLIQDWWNGFVVEGCPDFKLSMKLKILK